nr:leucine-rich repeat domain-containing protein [Candidatus Sigynarchaeota archaeon]
MVDTKHVGDTFVTVHGKRYYINKESRLELGGLGIKSFGEIENLENITGLKRLLLSYNQIENVPAYKILRNLDMMSLGQNRLTSLDWIKECENLTVLYAADNQITSMASFTPLQHMEFVDLKNNRIERIEGMAGNNHLKILSLSNNRISKIEGLDGCVNLENLELNNNHITRIEGLEHLTHLKEIDLSSNNIERIENLGHLTAKLSLHGNPAIAEELNNINYNPVLWCRIKEGVAKLCDDLINNVAPRAEEYCAHHSPSGWTLGYPEGYMESFLHLKAVYRALKGRPAGSRINAEIKHSPWTITEPDFAIGVIHDILKTALFFHMTPNYYVDTSWLGAHPKDDEDNWETPDVRGWAAMLRRTIPRIVTRRWPDWYLTHVEILLINDVIIEDKDTRKHWLYFEAKLHDWGTMVEPPEDSLLPSVKHFFGRTLANMYISDIQVLKLDIAAKHSWKQFLSEIKDPEIMAPENYEIFDDAAKLMVYVRNSLS